MNLKLIINCKFAVMPVIRDATVEREREKERKRKRERERERE